MTTGLPAARAPSIDCWVTVLAALCWTASSAKPESFQCAAFVTSCAVGGVAALAVAGSATASSAAVTTARRMPLPRRPWRCNIFVPSLVESRCAVHRHRAPWGQDPMDEFSAKRSERALAREDRGDRLEQDRQVETDPPA